MSKKLFFDVSTGLKRVIGRDLITNDEVAIFELVKNSFDANAGNVILHFEGQTFTVIDDGQGMSYDDLVNKWLFVAYLSKSNSIAVADPEYRDQIADRKNYAGSKGIGRFSSDRLGNKLVLQTRSSASHTKTVHQLIVDWELFENDSRQHFESIPVEYAEKEEFDLPKGVPQPNHGTLIRIENARIPWGRERIIQLKSALAKLINPFGSDTDGFKITVLAPDQVAEDLALQQAATRKNEEISTNSLANGEVGNFIFSTLRDKTTFTEVSISENGLYIDSKLIDRGEIIYIIREPNPFDLLIDSDFRCHLYYLNQAAKLTFARRMGIPSVQFGSIFLFRNGFRVYPIGEDGDDSFGIDRRKQQGFARFLGSRDIIGRLDVSGSEESFNEASSRNQGLIDSPAVRQMKDCFWEYCLKRLERYVVPVTWVDSAEKLSDDLSRLMTDSGKARVASAVARLVDNADVEVLAYSQRLITIINERSSLFEESLSSLRSIAEKTKDQELLRNLEKAELRFNELKSAEAEAIRVAAAERAAKEDAQKSASESRAQAQKLSLNLQEEKKRASFLASITSVEIDAMLNMHHQITIYAADLKQQIENCILAARSKGLTREETVSRLESVAYLNQKVLSISRLAVKANFRLESDTIEADLAEYIESYINLGAKPFLGAGIDVRAENNSASLIKRFGPMEVSIIVDNLISNAKKAGATQIMFTLRNSDKKTLLMSVQDNGPGISKDIESVDDIFSLGFSRSSGSGLGLYHVRQSLDEIGGSIAIDENNNNGAKFEIRIIL